MLVPWSVRNSVPNQGVELSRSNTSDFRPPDACSHILTTCPQDVSLRFYYTGSGGAMPSTVELNCEFTFRLKSRCHLEKKEAKGSHVEEFALSGNLESWDKSDGVRSPWTASRGITRPGLRFRGSSRQLAESLREAKCPSCRLQPTITTEPLGGFYLHQLEPEGNCSGSL